MRISDNGRGRNCKKKSTNQDILIA